jgi:hypothetical protein
MVGFSMLVWCVFPSIRGWGGGGCLHREGVRYGGNTHGSIPAETERYVCKQSTTLTLRGYVESESGMECVWNQYGLIKVVDNSECQC